MTILRELDRYYGRMASRGDVVLPGWSMEPIGIVLELDADGTLLDFDIREVQVSQAIIRNARRVILVTDGSKFLRSAPVRIAHLSDVDVLVTDRLPSQAVLGLCVMHGVEVVEAGGPVEPDEGGAEFTCSNESSI